MPVLRWSNRRGESPSAAYKRAVGPQTVDAFGDAEAYSQVQELSCNK